MLEHKHDMSFPKMTITHTYRPFKIYYKNGIVSELHVLVPCEKNPNIDFVVENFVSVQNANLISYIEPIKPREQKSKVRLLGYNDDELKLIFTTNSLSGSQYGFFSINALQQKEIQKAFHKAEVAFKETN